ncbi:MAG TPA: AcvB/VirJ family lysyl-phosphatidylglycerol hydrolase [Gemmatimonadaceae bacterium]|nr:AcvB/VirJ family lysyl-phosphatidylglycerol hydrolase [Gemmatimonadaceae bacterium]
MLLPLFVSILTATAQLPRDTVTDVRNLPIVELRAPHATSNTVAIILSGDGGWADIDEKVGKRLQSRGIDVVGLDMRDYLRGGGRSPAVIGRDVSRIARRYMALWKKHDVALVGYSRGSDLAPFAATNLAPDIRPHLTLIAMLALLERASFSYHFSDLWRTTSGKDDTPILPQLQALKGVPMVCVYGAEEKESLCRSAPAGLMTVIERKGKHHFDGNYNALGDIVYQAVMRSANGTPLGDLDAPQ